MKAAPTFNEVEEKLSALVAGRISREDADRWAGQWVYAAESPQMTRAIWNALQHLTGCDLRHGPQADYLHSADQFEKWLQEIRASESSPTT